MYSKSKTNCSDHGKNLSPIPEDARSVQHITTKSSQLMQMLKTVDPSKRKRSHIVSLPMLSEGIPAQSIKNEESSFRKPDRVWMQEPSKYGSVYPVSFNHNLKYQYMAQCLAVSALSNFQIFTLIN